MGRLIFIEICVYNTIEITRSISYILSLDRHTTMKTVNFDKIQNFNRPIDEPKVE